LVVGFEADLKNNRLRGHIAGAEKRVESNDGLGQKLAQLKPTPRPTQAIRPWNRLEPDSLQPFRGSPLLRVPEPSGPRPTQAIRPLNRLEPGSPPPFQGAPAW